MIKVTTIKTTAIIFSDDYRKKWLEDGFFEKENKEYKEIMNMTNEEFFSEVDLKECLYLAKDIEEKNKTIIEKF